MAWGGVHEITSHSCSVNIFLACRSSVYYYVIQTIICILSDNLGVKLREMILTPSENRMPLIIRGKIGNVAQI